MVEAKKLQRTFAVVDGKNFVGFVHPKDRKFVTANDKGLFVVDEKDEKAISILTRAADVTEITNHVK